MPNYNGVEHLSESIKSVQKQTYSNWELLIVDDNSQDNSIAMIKSIITHDKRIKLHHHQGNRRSGSACRNIGITNSTGEYIIFLDSDDILKETCLERRIEFMNNNSSLNFAVFKMSAFNREPGDNGIIINKYHDSKESYLKAFLNYKIPWPITAPIWKRSFFTKNNIKFSEKFQRLQDPEFHSKILFKYNPSFKVIKNGFADCYYRLPDSNKLKPSLKSYNNSVKGFYYYFEDIQKFLNTSLCGDDLKHGIISSYRTLLFNYKLPLGAINVLLKFNLNKAAKLNVIAPIKIIIFYMFNITRLSFIKGAGITFLWNRLTKINT